MRYISTRGQAAPLPFCDILLGGLASDGGLYLPEYYPQVSRAELEAWRDLSYPELAFTVLSLFIDDIPLDDLRHLIGKTYSADVYRFSRKSEAAAQITPLVRLEERLYIQELSNGPTLAFKDIALQLLGQLFEYVLERNDQTLNILGATSGDTGSAAEYAMRGKKRIRVFMLSPNGKGMTPFQAAQMYSLPDANIFNLAINGMFDAAQRIVKTVFNDAAYKEQYRLGAVNSINWARVAAQIVYYFWGYFRATKNNDELVSFAVPTGNFGNICAGHIARMMGLPIDRLVLATNENNILDVFFRTGVYRPRPSVVTSSPSMDISLSSNSERFFFDCVGRDARVMRWLLDEAGETGSFDLSKTAFWPTVPRFGIVSGQSQHADRLAIIRLVRERYGIIIDTHTADGFKVALEHRHPGQSMVVMETAQPAKFGAAISEALGVEPARPKELDNLESLPQRVTVLEPDVQRIKEFIACHVNE